ncbi:hypothetical protein [Brachyspira pilosicoli]|uniref:hypothetical protein n=1 Tax=Brachyspira pilosicoli TaxID=52584 RepID=UPI0030063F3D
MNKKIFKTLLLIFSLSLFAISCGGNTSTNPDSDGNNTQQPGDGGDGGNTGDGGSTSLTLKDRTGTYFGGPGIFFNGDGVVSTLHFERGGNTWNIVNPITLGDPNSTETKFFFNSVQVKYSEQITLVSISIEFIDNNNVKVIVEDFTGTYKRF